MGRGSRLIRAPVICRNARVTIGTTVKEYSKRQTAVNMSVNSKITNVTDKEQALMSEVTSMSVNTKKIKRTAKDFIHGLTGAFMPVNGEMTKSTAWGHLRLPMAENMLVNRLTVKNMGVVG